MVGLPLARVLLPSRFVIGCAGLWQLCDAVRAVGCRSRFVLLAQQANSSLMGNFTAHDPHDVERRRAYPTRSRRARIERSARGRMTYFYHPPEMGSMAMAAQDAVAAASMQKTMR